MKKTILSAILLLYLLATGSNAQTYICNPEQIHVAVILPFALDQPQQSVETQKALDFYEGILLTVDSLKKAGVSIDLLVLDEGTAEKTKIQAALQNPMLKEADIIIGPGRNADVSPLAAFAQANQIPLVVPFATTPNIAAGRPYVFQCNTLQTAHYQKVFDRIARHNAQDNIIFVDMNERNSKDTFTADLRKHLTEKGIRHTQISFSDFDEKLPRLLDTTRDNTLIPTCTTSQTFDMLCLKLTDMNLSETHRIRLIGTPEWQTFPAKSQKNMYQYSATYFTTLYNNNLSTRTKNFIERFRNAFHRDQYPSYPRYGEMGHDISAYFLTAIQRYRNQFFQNIRQHDYNSLQIPLRFTRPDQQSGHTNQATYMIYYKPEGDVILSTF